MLLSVCMMCAGSLVIACLPTYEAIGSWAPALLLLARLFQGLSVGGEYGTSATYMSEVAIKGRRGFYASFQYVTLIGGQLLALLVLVILQQILSGEELKAWGWRIPFALGAVLAVVALYLRRSLNETSDAKTRNHKDAGSLTGLWKNRKAFLMVLGFTAAGSLTFYTFTTYMQKYLVNTAGMDAKLASAIMTVALFVFMLLQPVVGAFSDKIGRRSSMLIFSALATVLTVPILFALKEVTNPFMAFGLIVLALFVVSFYTAISGLLKAEMFPPEVRALGRLVLCGSECPVRRFGGICRAVAEIVRRGERFLLVRFRHVPAGVAGLAPAASQRQGDTAVIKPRPWPGSEYILQDTANQPIDADAPQTANQLAHLDRVLLNAL